MPGRLRPPGPGHPPASCKLRIENADPLRSLSARVVAVRDAIVLRLPGQMAVYLVVNAADEHIRFRYLHMLPEASSTRTAC